MRNYDPEKIKSYTNAFAQHIQNIETVLDLLNNQPRTRDIDILRDGLIKSTVDLATKVGNGLLESMLDYCDVDLPYAQPELITHTFNVPELDTAFKATNNFNGNEEEYFNDEEEEEEDDDDEDFETTQ